MYRMASKQLVFYSSQRKHKEEFMYNFQVIACTLYIYIYIYMISKYN
jgi:hypothetical protein